MFWVHSAICILLCILAIFILPETQGKTLTELSEMYSNNSIKALDEINKITTERDKEAGSGYQLRKHSVDAKSYEN